MEAYGITEPRLRSVLPFKAVPEELRRLRSSVKEQTGLWGLADLADDAELAVGELTANVLRHVGEGAAATLVLAMGDGRFRIEAHDGCHAAPAMRHPTEYDEGGRGLRLLAALAADWGTLLTGSGKAVWCEFALGTKEDCQRLRRTARTLEVYGAVAGRLAPTSARNLALFEELVMDLMADLLHWLAKQGRDPGATLNQAQGRYEGQSGTA